MLKYSLLHAEQGPGEDKQKGEQPEVPAKASQEEAFPRSQ